MHKIKTYLGPRFLAAVACALEVTPRKTVVAIAGIALAASEPPRELIWSERMLFFLFSGSTFRTTTNA